MFSSQDDGRLKGKMLSPGRMLFLKSPFYTPGTAWALCLLHLTWIPQQSCKVGTLLLPPLYPWGN